MLYEQLLNVTVFDEVFGLWLQEYTFSYMCNLVCVTIGQQLLVKQTRKSSFELGQ